MWNRARSGPFQTKRGRLGRWPVPGRRNGIAPRLGRHPGDAPIAHQASSSGVPPQARRLRVVFLGHVARLSGGEIALLRFLPALQAHADVRVILGEDGPLVERLRSLGIETEVLPMPERLRDLRRDSVRPSRLDLRALVDLPAYVQRLSRRIRELEADLVHTNTLKAAFYGAAAARLAHVPVVWHVRDRIAPDYLPRPAVTLVRALARLLPAAVIANSEETMRTLPHLRTARVVYNAVVPDAVEEASVAERPPGGAVTIGVIGRLAPWKGQHVFLEAFAEAFRGTETRGRVIGSDLFGEDAYAGSLRRRAAELGVADQVEFLGFREDVWAELRELDVLVHCSVTPEPFGQVVLEGMAAGVAVVATSAGGPAELITEGVDGLLTVPGDVGELAEALRRLAADSSLRQRLGAAARVRSRDFTPERTAQLVLETYEYVLRRRRRSDSQRVVHVVTTAQRFAGVERYVAGVAAETASRGWEVTVVGGQPAAMQRALDGTARWLPGGNARESLVSLARLGRVDVCHAHMTKAEALAVVARPLHRAPVVATRHFAQPRGATLAGRLLAPWIVRGLARQLAVSEYVAGQLESPPDAVLLHAVPAVPLLWRREARVVLVLQRLSPEKDTLTALRAWAESGLADEGWTLRVVGDGGELPLLERWAREHAVAAVEFTGWTDRPEAELAGAGIFLASAGSEPAGITVLEAMAAGIPVVAAAAGGHLETVGRVEGAPGFPPGDVAAAASSLRALADESVRSELSRRVRAAALERITPAEHVDRLLEQYARARVGK